MGKLTEKNQAKLLEAIAELQGIAFQGQREHFTGRLGVFLDMQTGVFHRLPVVEYKGRRMKAGL